MHTKLLKCDRKRSQMLNGLRSIFILSFLIVIIPAVISQDTETENNADNNTDYTVSEEQLPIQDNEGVSDQATTEDELGLWAYIRMVLVLGLVLLMIYGVFHFLKRKSRLGPTNTGPIKIIASQSFGGNRYLHLIEVGNQIFLIGSADSGVNMISAISDQETIDEIRLGYSPNQQGVQKSFQTLLKSVFKRNNNTDHEDLSVNGYGTHGLSDKNSFHVNKSIDFIKQQRERLKKM